jgi:hypothetical protein
LPYNGDNQFSIIYLSALIISLIITSIIIAIQLRKNLKGTKINIKKSTIFLIYYILIVSFLIYNSFSTGVPLTYILPYVMIIILSGYYSYWYSKRNLLFWRDNDNNLYAKGGLLIYLIYITALVVRIAINLVFIGYQEVNFTESGNIVIINHPLVHMSFKTRIISLIVTDLLITIGTGMLIGRYARVMDHFMSKIKTE